MTDHAERKQAENHQGLEQAVQPVLRAIVACFGPACEASLVKMEENGRAVILAIENGAVTGRRVGDEAPDHAPSPPTGLPAGEPAMRVVTDAAGRRFRCASAWIGPGLAISIVLEITVLEFMLGFLRGILDMTSTGRAGAGHLPDGTDQPAARPAAGGGGATERALFDLRNALATMLEDAEVAVGRPVALMTRDDKLRIIRELDRRGAFLLRNSVEDVARALQVSRFTVYNYLDSARQQEIPQPGTRRQAEDDARKGGEAGA